MGGLARWRADLLLAGWLREVDPAVTSSGNCLGVHPTSSWRQQQCRRRAGVLCAGLGHEAHNREGLAGCKRERRQKHEAAIGRAGIPYQAGCACTVASDGTAINPLPPLTLAGVPSAAFLAMIHVLTLAIGGASWRRSPHDGVRHPCARFYDPQIAQCMSPRRRPQETRQRKHEVILESLKANQASKQCRKVVGQL